MKTSLMILAAITGLFGGACVGYLTISENPEALAPNEAQATESSPGDPKSKVLDFGSNTRIARFFTALNEPVTLKQRAELFEALRSCTAKDMPNLMARVQALPYTTRWDLTPMVIEHWFDLDLAAARDWVRAGSHKWGVTAWAKADPQSAIREAALAPNADYADDLLTGAIPRLAPGNPVTQAAALAEIPAGVLRNRVLRSLIYSWALNDPAFAYASLEQLPPGWEREEARTEILRKWAERDPNAALAQMDALLPSLKAGVLGNELTTKIAEQIGEKDSKLALDWISKLPVEFRIAPAIGVARIWAAKEPEAALNWCMENGVDVARGHRDGFQGWGTGVLGEAMAAHPEATISWLQTLPAGMERDRLLEKGLDDALWVAPKDVLFADENPLWVQLFQGLTEEGQIRLANNIGMERAKLGGLTDLGTWVQNFPSAAARTQAIIGAIAAAYMRDTTMIDPLLTSISSTSDRDAAINTVVGIMVIDAPASAAARALTISDEAHRCEALDFALKSWQKRDPIASRAWLGENSSIPASWKAKWLQAQ